MNFILYLLCFGLSSFAYQLPSVNLNFGDNNYNDKAYGVRTSSVRTNYSDGHYQKVYCDRLSSEGFREQFYQATDESDILSNYELYAYPNFITYARTLFSYPKYILSLDERIKCDKSFRKQTAFVPGFSYKFGIRSEQSGFHDFIHKEACLIVDQQKQYAAVIPKKSNVSIAGQSLNKFKSSCEARVALGADNYTTQRLIDRIQAVDEFNKAPGMQLDCQLRKELDESHNVLTQLEHVFSGNYYVQTIAPVIYRYIIQAQVEQCIVTAFELSDFCYTATQLLSHGMNVLYGTLSVVGKGAWKGTKEFVNPDHWRGMATGALQLGLLSVDAVGQEAALDYAMHGALLSDDPHAVTKVAHKYYSYTQAQKDSLNECAQQTYQKIQAMSWQELAENGAELGTTMILDTLALHALSGFTHRASGALAKQLSGAMESGALLTEQYAVEVAGFGKLIVEEGAEISAKAADIIKNDLVFFADSTGPISQKIRYNVPSTGQLEDLVHKIRNVGDDILDVMEKAGGHTLERHVAQTYDELLLRSLTVDAEAITTFINKRIAVKAIKESLKHHAEKLCLWLSDPLQDKLIIEFSHIHPIGNGIIKGKKNPFYNLTNSRMVLKRNVNCELGFQILTAFPVM